MVGSIETALSGLQNATARVNSAANNIANITTPKSNNGDDGVIIDLSEEAVNLITAEAAFKANLATIRAAEELSDDLLDILDD